MAVHFKEWPGKPENLVLEEKEKGQGSYGRVYIGKLAGNPVAVKVIYPNLLRAPGNDHLLLGFKEECAKLQSLKHDRVVKLLGTFWDKSLGPLLVMEVLDQNLEEFLRDHSKPGSLPLMQQLEFVKEVTEGLRYLHSHNIVHRDLKPANILIGKDGHLRIGDLGQSKLLNNLSDIMKTMQPGTPLFLPPEALKKGSAYTLKIDVFSLGVVTLCIATQAAPTTDIMNIGSIPEIIRRKEDLDRLEAKHPLMGVISACLQDDPNLRPDVCFIDDHLGVLVGNGRLVNKLEESLSEQRKELMDLNKLYNLQKKELADSKSKFKVQESKCRSHLQTIKRQTKELDAQKQALDEEQEAKQHQKEKMLQKVSNLEAKLKEKEVEMQSRICLLEKTFRDDTGKLKEELQNQEFECQSHLQTIERQKKELNVQKLVLDEEQKEKQLLQEEMARRISNLEAELKMEHDNYEKDMIGIEETLAIQQQKWDELCKLSTDAFDRNKLLEGDVRELRKRLTTYKSRLELEFNQFKCTTNKQQLHPSEREPFSPKAVYMKDSHELFKREHKIGHSQSEIGYKRALDQMCPHVEQPHSLTMSTYTYYIKVSGLSDAISTEDIVAHFQTAECGGGTVSEVIILGPHKSIALVRIEGISLDPSHEFFKREHKIGHSQSGLKVEMATYEPSPDQRQNAAYKIGPPHGTTSSLPISTQQLPPPDSSSLVCLDGKKGAVNIFFPAQSISASSDTTQVDTTNTEVNSDTKRPSTQLRAEVHKLTHISSKCEEQTPSYIIVIGLTDSISTEDIVTHFQTARCGGGTVTEVIYLEQSKARALVGITGIELNSSHKLFKGIHKIGNLRLKVETTSTPPTPEQRWNAVYSIGPQPGITLSSPKTQQTELAFLHVRDQQKSTSSPCITQQMWPPISTDQQTPPPVSTNQPTQPPFSTNQLTRPPYSTNQPTPPPISTNQPTPPPISTNQPTQPPYSTNQPTRPPISTNQPTPPPISTNQPTQPPFSTNQPTRPPISTNQPTQPPFSTNQPTRPPFSTNQPTRPPFSTNQPTYLLFSTHQPTRKIPPVDVQNYTTLPGTGGQQGNSAQPKYSPWSGTPNDTLERSKPLTRQGSSSVDAASPIQLRRGGLTDHQADVYVNIAHRKLDLKHGTVAQSLLTSGGPALQAECNQYIAQHGSVPVWGYATTGGGNLRCKHVIHAVATWYDGPGGSAKKGMERMLSNIMAECDRLGVSSVAFPAIDGALGFPDDLVAKTMIQAVSTYLCTHPSTTVKQVLLVIFEDKTYKAFQSVMQTSTSVPTPSYTPGAVQQPGQSLYDHADKSRFEKRGGHHSFNNPPPGQHAVLQSFTCNHVAIDIVHGDITEEDCDGLVSTSSHDLTLHNFGVMGALLRKGGPELQRDCTSAVQRQGNLSSSKVIITGAGRPGGLKCKKILHVLAPMQPDGLCKIVKEVLKKADGERLGVVALPAIGTGNHGFSAEQAAEGIYDAIVEFSEGSHNHVYLIKVVLFQEELYLSFSTAFSNAGAKKGIAKKAKQAWNYTKEVFGSISRGFSSDTTFL